MKKLISLFMAMQLALPLYSNETEYSSVGQQFNTVVINVPASLIIKQGDEHIIKVNNMSNERFVYEISNDTLFIKNKYIIDDAGSMVAENLKIRLVHPSPDELFQNIRIPKGFTIKQNKNKSGNQN
jgi:hypothetical protein